MDGFIVKQYLHRPNSTELGMGNTHETYLLVKAEHDVKDMFPNNMLVSVNDIFSSKSYTLKSAFGREFRINQMGEIYRDYNVRPGDEIILSFIRSDNLVSRFLQVKKYNRVVFITSSRGSEIINIERLRKYEVGNRCYEISWECHGINHNIVIQFLESRKKRQDSPNSTDFYTIKYDGGALLNGTSYLDVDNGSELLILDKSELCQYSLSNDLVKKLYSQIPKENSKSSKSNKLEEVSTTLKPYFPIIRTKPFLLLAGISGTGKSRIVKEMAFASCPNKGGLQKDRVTPGNYLLVEVKPNWHDSTELLGYESGIKNTYVLTPFIKFLYKAMRYPDVPFFVCLDEMNLAPVEQYFAEFLSVLESRKQIDGGNIVSEPLIKKSIFRKYELEQELLRDEEEPKEYYKTSDSAASYSSEYENLREYGLRIPQNVVVVGTVNMDETTHQFSRKVIDRAMTIEMNEVNFGDFFESNKDLDYYPAPLAADNFISKYSSASQAMKVFDENEVEIIKEKVPDLLNCLNIKLENTPFKVAYRVQNEIILYLAALKEENIKDGQAYDIATLLNTAFDDIMLMKVLPRIEGDSELLSKPLDELYKDAKEYNRSSIKIKEMKDRLESGSNFTSFWP